MSEGMINNVQLKFQLEAERKQREYAEARAAYTAGFRREFAHWQRDVTQTRARLFRIIRWHHPAR